MEQPVGKKRFPSWLRFVIWLFLILLVLAMPLSLVRWLIESSHQTAVALAKPRGKLPKSAPGKGMVASSLKKESVTSRGIPLAEVPLVGVYAVDDEAAKKELEKQLEEIRNLLAYSQHNECWVDGVLSFRAVLAKMGMAVPDTMTEADAAAEFLKRTERFSPMLAQWRQAVGNGPWDFSSLETNDSSAAEYKIFRVAYSFQSLLGIMAQAHLRSGDADGAWADLQTMNSSAERGGEIPGSYQSSLRWQVIHTARAGMEPEAWTDTQLMKISTMMGEENALDSARSDMESQKRQYADYFAHFRDHQSEIEETFARSKSPIDKMINRFGIATATDQQLADNLAVMNFKIDQAFTRFDPVTGFYLGESAEDSSLLPHSKPSDVSFDKFYYMYYQQYGTDPDSVVEWIIREQSGIDQTRIAAALEIQRRATGEYPATLDAVSATFGGRIPRDIATGQSYFYQRDADGGYKLWGTGIDGKSDGGDGRSDVTWTHRPVKK